MRKATIPAERCGPTLDDSHETIVVKPVNGIKTFELTTVKSKGHMSKTM